MPKTINVSLTSEWKSVRGTVAAPSGGVEYDVALIGNGAQLAQGTASDDIPAAGVQGHPIVDKQGGFISIPQGGFVFARNRNPQGASGGTLVLTERE